MDEANVKYITTLKEIRVINDPYRREIMDAMSLIDKPATSKDIADFMGEPPSKVNYHVQVLHKYGFIDFHHTKNINGIMAKYYVRSSSIFKIKIEGKNSHSKEMAAVRDIIVSTFDQARDKYLAAIAKSIENADKECKKPENDKKIEIEDFLYSKHIYLNEKEAIELAEFIEKAANNKKEGRKLYNLFASYIELDKSFDE